MTIYTRTGDKGTTSLYDGTRVDKDDIRIETYGMFDELTSYIGLCACICCGQEKNYLRDIQNKLFQISTELVTGNVSTCGEDVRVLESWTTHYDVTSTSLFIIPGTNIISSHLHVARTICRRLERTLCTLSRYEEVNSNTMKYVNRLSDLLYVLAKYNESDIVTPK